MCNTCYAYFFQGTLSGVDPKPKFMDPISPNDPKYDAAFTKALKKVKEDKKARIETVKRLKNELGQSEYFDHINLDSDSDAMSSAKFMDRFKTIMNKKEEQKHASCNAPDNTSRVRKTHSKKM
jgi:hypothetical protein